MKMIDKEFGKYLLICDDCGIIRGRDDRYQNNFDCFDDAVFFAKGANYSFKKTKDGWEHYCPDCQAVSSST
jgi:hypothetical protein